jgi:predicted negative regulator of RcsB-dependent stress response
MRRWRSPALRHGGVYATARDRSKAANQQFTALAEQYGWLSEGAKAHYFAGVTYEELGQNGAAETELKTAAGAWDRNLANLAKLALASLYHQTSRDAEAISLYNALAAKPSDTVSTAVAQLDLADLYAATGKLDQARALWAKVKDADKEGCRKQVLRHSRAKAGHQAVRRAHQPTRLAQRMAVRVSFCFGRRTGVDGLASEHFHFPARLVNYERGSGSILRLDGNRRQGHARRGSPARGRGSAGGSGEPVLGHALPRGLLGSAQLRRRRRRRAGGVYARAAPPRHAHEVRDQRVWLIRIVWNVVLDRKRRSKTRPETDDVAELARVLPAGG